MDWISVKNEMPEHNEVVLCYSDKNGGYFFLGYWNDTLGAWCKDGLMHCYNVLYWCPLEAPKGE
jgi:hypothetical protein